MDTIEQIKTKNPAVFLMILGLKDAGEVYASVQNSRKHLAEYSQYNVNAFSTEENTREILSAPQTLTLRFGIWVVNTVTEKEEFAGLISATFNKIGDEAEIGYWIDKDHTKKGYAKTAVMALVSYILSKYPNVNIFAKVVVGNLASERVLIGSGFVAQDDPPINEPPKGSTDGIPVPKIMYTYRQNQI